MLTESGADMIAAKRLTARQVAAEELELHSDEERDHIAFTVRARATAVIRRPERSRLSDLARPSSPAGDSSSMAANTAGDPELCRRLTRLLRGVALTWR